MASNVIESKPNRSKRVYEDYAYWSEVDLEKELVQYTDLNEIDSSESESECSFAYSLS